MFCISRCWIRFANIFFSFNFKANKTLRLCEVLWYVFTSKRQTERQRGKISNHCISGVIKGAQCDGGTGAADTEKKRQAVVVDLPSHTLKDKMHSRPDLTRIHTPRNEQTTDPLCVSVSVHVWRLRLIWSHPSWMKMRKAERMVAWTLGDGDVKEPGY